MRSPLRTVLRGLALGLAGLVLLCMAGATAWVLANREDVPPQPLPPELARPQAQVPDARNVAYALMGLLAEDGRDAATAGRALHVAEQAQATLSFAQRREPAREAAYVKALSAAMGRRHLGLQGPPAICAGDEDSCTNSWLSQTDALARQREAARSWGQRCEALLDAGFEFEEVWPALRSLAEPVATHAGPAAACALWLRSGAVLEWAQGRRDAALQQLRRADALQRGLLQGSHSLLGQAIAWRVSQQVLGTMADLALRDASLAVALQPMLAPPLPDGVAGARRWITFEAQYGNAALDEVLQRCLMADEAVPGLKVAPGERAFLRVEGWLCRHRIGLHPERTRQLAASRWLALSQAVGAGWPAAIAQARQPGTPGLAWRNTLGELLVQAGAGAYTDHLARQADVNLRHEATRLAVAAAAQKVPADQREAWARRQTVSDTLRPRLRWADGGRVLTVQTWQEQEGAASPQAHRNAIRLAWPG